MMSLTFLISIAVIHALLWVKGIKPSSRGGLWEYLSWQVFPKDDQTRDYLRQRFLIGIAVLPTTALILYVISEGLGL
jgi:hypothetical protein